MTKNEKKNIAKRTARLKKVLKSLRIQPIENWSENGRFDGWVLRQRSFWHPFGVDLGTLLPSRNVLTNWGSTDLQSIADIIGGEFNIKVTVVPSDTYSTGGR